MPRKKLLRRFEPRSGVSQAMLEVEGGYVRQELEDYLLRSENELRERLKELKERLATTGESLQAMLAKVADRERLALRCMMARDFFHIAALYESFLGGAELPKGTIPPKPTPEELTPAGKPVATVPFREWLFDDGDSSN
jgi:hypothetical protein